MRLAVISDIHGNLLALEAVLADITTRGVDDILNLGDWVAGPLWPRYSEIGTDRPLFGDRDLTIHDDVNEISAERRNGYGWFTDGPKRTLDHYTTWAKAHPAP